MTKYIDISSYQTNVDFAKVKASGISGVVLRSTSGKSYARKDTMFEKHYLGAKAAGLPIHVYMYTYATTEARAHEDAFQWLKDVAGKSIKKMWLDVEDTVLTKIPTASLLKIISIFKTAVESSGYDFGIYTGMSFYNTYLKGLNEPDLWIARYPTKAVKDISYTPSESYKPSMATWGWQYSSTTQIPGISGNVDVSIVYAGETASVPTSTVVNTSKVMIGHASQSEKGTKYGLVGDQTGKEVCTREWYSKPWQYCIRFKDPKKAEIVASNIEKACANDLVGYDQSQRLTLYEQYMKTKDISKISVGCECDCSSLVSLCCIIAGANIPASCTTSNLKNKLAATNQVVVYTESKYLANSANLKRGDILLKEGSHVVVCLTDATNNPSYYPKYMGTSGSILLALQTVGESDTSMDHRKKIAAANGIKNYSGTAEQNTTLVNKLKNGSLVIA